MSTNFKNMPDQELNHLLSTEDYYKGYRLTWYNPVRMGGDPTILFLHGKEVYRWEYDPTMGEVWDKIRELEASV